MAEFIGSAGTLVGAALESSGYFYQSFVLDFLLGPLRGISYLIWVVGAVYILTTWVVQGRSPLSNWVLLGPVLFFAILTSRVNTKGVDWIYGSEPRNSAKVEQRTKELLGGNFYQAEVPALFANYNRIVSASTRSLVSAINATREKMDLKMITRAQLYSSAMNPDLQDPRLRELLHLSLLGDCQRLLDEGREMVDKKNAPEERCAAAKRFKELADKPVTNVSSAQSVDYLSGVLVDNPRLWDLLGGKRGEAEIQRFLTGYNTEFGPSCTIDTTSSTGTTTGSTATVPPPTIRVTATGTERKPPSGPRSAADIKAAADPQREAKKQEWREKISARAFTCHDVWVLVYAGLEQSAALTVGSTVDQAKRRGFKPDEVITFLAQLTGQSGGSGLSEDQALVRAIARRLFKDEAAAGSRAAFIAQYERRGAQVSGVGVRSTSELDFLERARGESRQKMQQTMLMMHALSLPYYQGLILYFLSVAFPFFCMLLLIPGKQTGFHMWFVLWLWAKSWDIGYAVVALVDDTLFSLFVSKLSDINNPAVLQLDPSLSVASLALRELDPTFNLSTYYNIIAVLIQMIPFIMSYIIIGGVTQGASIVSAGINRTLTGRFGMGGGVATGAQLSESQFRIDDYRSAQQEDQFAAATRSITGEGGGEGGGATGENVGVDPTLLDRTGTGFMGYTSEQLLDMSNKFAAASGFASGFNFTNNFLPGAVRRMQLVNGVVDGAVQGAGVLSREGENAILDYTQAQYLAAASWANYDAARNYGMNTLEARMAFGQLPVMDIAPSGYQKEWEAELHRYSIALGLVAAGSDAAGEAGSSILGGFLGPGGSKQFWRKHFGKVAIAGGILGASLLSSKPDKKEDTKPEDKEKEKSTTPAATPPTTAPAASKPKPKKEKPPRESEKKESEGARTP